MKLEFSVLEGQGWKHLKTVTTNKDGRTDEPLLEGRRCAPAPTSSCFTSATISRARTDAFLDLVPIRFGIADASAHYHVPLLCSPWGYTTYRGS